METFTEVYTSSKEPAAVSKEVMRLGREFLKLETTPTLRLAGPEKPKRLIVVLDPTDGKQHVCDVWCTHPGPVRS